MDDSFDLFGGLPTASKGSSQNVPLEKTGDTSSQPSADDVDVAPVENSQPSKSIADDDEKLTEKQGASLVSSIGNAGTAMVRAYIPFLYVPYHIYTLLHELIHLPSTYAFNLLVSSQ